MLPLLNSLTHLTYLTSTSPRIRDILVNDGGLERLLEIMQESALPRDHCLEPNFDWFGLRGPPTASILTQAQQVALKHSLAFQCVVNIGVRGSETIRTRLVQSGALNVVAQIMEVWLQQKGVWIFPGPLGSQASVERAIAAGVLPPVQDGSVDWRAGYSRFTSRRTRDRERDRTMPHAPPPSAAGTEERREQDNRDMSVDPAGGNVNPLRAPRRAPTGRERHERVSAWIETGGRTDGHPPPTGSGSTADPGSYPIAAWWNNIRRGIELNLNREDIPTQEDIGLFGITPATVPAWTRLFASIRSSGDNRRRLIRRLLRGDSSAQSIMEIMFMLGLDPWETKERLKRAVRVSPQGEVMIVTSHQHLGPGASGPQAARQRPLATASAEATTQTGVQQRDAVPTVQERVLRSGIQRMEQVAADNAPSALSSPRASANDVPAGSHTAPTSAPMPIPPRSGESSTGRNRQHARRVANPGSEDFGNDQGDSSAAPSVSSSTSDRPTGQGDTLREGSRNILAPRPDSATSSRSQSRLGQRNSHLLDVGNDGNSSGPSNNPSPISTPTNGLMARGSASTVMAIPNDLPDGRGPGRGRSGTITTATAFQVEGASSETLATRLTRATRDATHESMDIDEEDRPASRATTDAEGNGDAGDGEDGDAVLDESIDIVGINGEEETGDPLMNVLTEVEPNPDAQAELDIAMGAPRGAPGAAATTVAGEMTPRVPAAGLPMMATTMASPEPTDALEVEDNEEAGTEAQRQPVRQTQLPVTAVVIAAGAPRSFSDLGHLVASMDRNADPHAYTDDTILLSLQLFAYLSKYPHVRSAFHHPTRPLHYGVDISPEAKLPERPNFAKTANMFSLVERFTFRAAPPDPDMPKIPSDIQYWAGVIMRNACRKDDSRAGIRQCANMSCGKWEAYPRQFAKCRRCRKAKYCSKDCQSRAWQEGHRFW